MLVYLISHREAEEVLQHGMRVLRDFCVVTAVGSPRGGTTSDKSCNVRKNNSLCFGTFKFCGFLMQLEIVLYLWLQIFPEESKD